MIAIVLLLSLSSAAAVASELSDAKPAREADAILNQGRRLESQEEELKLLRKQVSDLRSAMAELITRIDSQNPSPAADAGAKPARTKIVSAKPASKAASGNSDSSSGQASAAVATKTESAGSARPSVAQRSPARQQTRASDPGAQSQNSSASAKSASQTEGRANAVRSTASQSSASQSSASQSSASQSSASQSGASQSAAAQGGQEAARPDDREQSEKERKAQLAEAIPIRSGGVLLPPGRLVLEPQFRYGFSSVNRVEITGYTILPALTLGIIDVTRRDRGTLTTHLTARYGLMNRLEVDFTVPYMAGWSRFRLSDKNTDANRDKNLTAEGRGIGDIRFGFRTQLNRGSNSVAAFVAGVGFRIPTGTSPYEVKRGDKLNNFLEEEVPTGSGFYSLSPTLSFVYPTEPGVIFGSLHYSWNIARHIDAVQPSSQSGAPYGKIDPGDVIGGSLGMGLSLNNKLSLSLSYDHSVVLKTKQNGITPEDAVPLQVGTLGLGATMRRSSNISYSFMISVGVTDDAPDVGLSLRVPITLNLGAPPWYSNASGP